MSEKETIRSCADCGSLHCSNPGEGAYPPFCLTTAADPGSLSQIIDQYSDGDDHEIMLASSMVEAEGYGRLTRVEEIMDFARRMNITHIGIASCAGLIEETRIITKIYRSHGFRVTAAACKVGALSKTEAGLPEVCNNTGPHLCNPILQARLLNEAGVGLKVVVGLCVGHDSLFYKYAEAPVTTLIVKDRVLAHNPAGAVYNANTYYKKLISKG